MKPGTIRVHITCALCGKASHFPPAVRSTSHAAAEAQRRLWIRHPELGWICPLPKCRSSLTNILVAVGAGKQAVLT